MRNIPSLLTLWDEDPQLIGDRATHAVVTVEPDWYLTLSETQVGTSTKGPFRWWQRQDNSQTEVQVPNVISINWDRSVETDAASCEITIKNDYLDYDNPAPLPGQLGVPGYYTWNHGESGEAAGRWNQTENVWSYVLVPNALLRTYEGFGGRDKDWQTAIADGDVVLTGVWLVDEVQVGTDGMMNLRCRDMAKLLIEQQVYLPFVPESEYPLKYYRWTYEYYDATFDARPQIPKYPPPPTGPSNRISLSYAWSSADAWYGFNADIYGHRGTHTLDKNTDTYAMSVGNSHPSKLFCTDYWEYTVNAPEIEWIYVHPWGGNYTMYISVFEYGAWVSNGAGNIPYDPSELYSSQPNAVDTGADIPYVMVTSTPWEKGQWYRLPRIMRGTKLRITFRNHAQTWLGPWYFRCGIREVEAGGPEAPPPSVGTSESGQSTNPWTFGFASNPVGEGYLVVDESGDIFAFGDSREYAQTNDAPQDGWAVAIEYTPTALGYYVLLDNGRVKTYGDAVWQGDASATGHRDFFDMALTNTGDGYYLLRRTGPVYAYGDATYYGDATEPTANGQAIYIGTGMDTHPTLDGYWVMNGDGEVTAFGSLPDYGGIVGRSGLSTNEWCRAIRSNIDGSGYYILTGTGKVLGFGSAETYSIGVGTPVPVDDPEDPLDNFEALTYDMGISKTGEGYYVLRAGGQVFTYGDAQYFGNAGGTGILRYPGNYLDYTDIIRELLLWSGWLFYDTTYDPAEPAPVYGNLETTGAYSDEPLPEDVFDKKPVIDAINTIKEIVGYLFWVDDEGAARFESPNWWMAGNFYEDGSYTSFIPEIDETRVLTEYRVRFADRSARSEIIVSTEMPEKGNETTVTTRYTPGTAGLLRGMVKPAMWVNGVFTRESEQQIMTELIAMHIWFSMRMGAVTVLANPAIQINDQVRIFERQTSETFIHYVRSIRSQHNLETGEWLYDLETNWLGDGENWVITRDNIPDAGELQQIQISSLMERWLDQGGNNKITIARLSGEGEVERTSFVPDEDLIDPVVDPDPDNPGSG